MGRVWWSRRSRSIVWGRRSEVKAFEGVAGLSGVFQNGGVRYQVLLDLD